MKNAILTLGLLLALSAPQGRADNVRAVQAAHELIARVTPGYEQQFTLEIIPSASGADTFHIAGSKGRVALQGNNTVALAVAYHQYLKYTCHAQLSWCGSQLSLPRTLPAPRPQGGSIAGRHRVYMNYCTVSYSMAWWNWDRWQREIDYMAMNGINMPLLTVGLEAVWYNTLLRYGFTDAEARAFLCAPAHSAWQWMQNIEGYGGPLPKRWIDEHAILGKKMLDRMLQLGMHPIQQGFSGYVPHLMKEKFPQANIRLQPSWCGFKGSAQLDPTDSLFLAFGRDFLEEEKKLFGAHGYYAADPFHESAPPVNTPQYLHQVGENILRVIKQHDAQGTWVMQGWDMREAIVRAVPKADLLILDLNSAKVEQTKGVWGYSVVTGQLHNFGGRVILHGDLNLLAGNPFSKQVRKTPNACGTGLFMEGINQNPVYYDLAFELPLHQDSINIKEWLAQYAWRRYGGRSAKAEKAWQLLLDGPYRRGTNGTEKSSIFAARPALDVKKSGPNWGFSIPYKPLTLWQAEDLLLSCRGSFAGSDGYRFDVVDVLRQCMSNLGQVIHRRAAESFRAGRAQAFKEHSSLFLELMSDADSLLRTRPEYSFDQWLTDARSHGTTPAEKDLYERDATALLTIWGPEPTPHIFDYAWREWSGLLGGFYRPRWELFYRSLADSLSQGRTYTEQGLRQVYGRETFRANSLYEKMAGQELAFVNRTGKARTPATRGDAVKVALGLYRKWHKEALVYYDGLNVPSEGMAVPSYENVGEKQ